MMKYSSFCQMYDYIALYCIKRDIFKIVAERILTYGSETWTLKAKEMKRVNSCYTSLFRRIQNISWRKHFTLSQIYGDLQPLSVTLAKRRAQFVGHAFRAKDEIISDISFGRLQQGGNPPCLIPFQETQE